GIIAGLGGPTVARIVHLPTRMFIAWVAGVARVSATLPLGELGPVALLVLVGCGLTYGALARSRSRSSRVLRRLAVLTMAATLVLPAIGLTRPPPDLAVAQGARLYRSGGATVLFVEGRLDVEDVMAGLRRTGTRRVDLIVGKPDLYLLRAMRHRWPVGTVIDPTTSTAGVRRVGGLLVTVGPNGTDRADGGSAEPVTVVAVPP
ncbi:MAG: hypothetical protein M3Y04_00230, partial [Actinomycetota bacterium]|nr:hypothetical protein [Actinomycetota bacterium]